MPPAKEETRLFPVDRERLRREEIRRILQLAADALRERGYRPVDQIVGYLMSGDPAYITSAHNARARIKRMERDVLLEEIVRSYVGRES